MRINKFAAWVVAVTVCLAGSLTSGVVAAASDPAPGTHKLDNATCEACHDGKKGKLEIAAADGAKRALYEVKQDKYAKSVHSKMECVACHQEITDSVAPHQKAAGAKKPNCAQCHIDLWANALGTAKEKPRLGFVVENIDAYKKSLHAKQNKDDPTKVNADCNDCHNVHTFDVPVRGTAERKEWHLTVPNVCGDKCHTDQLEEWSTSVHGVEVTKKHNLKAAVCSDCHTTHDITGSSLEKAKLVITANCGNCHQDRYASYKASYHGQVNTLGFAYTAKCFDCHGSHTIQPSKDPASNMNEKNRLKTCRKCHSGKKDLPEATAGFISFSPHGVSDDFFRYPHIWLSTKLMIVLLIGVFVSFWLHSGLWFYREYQERHDRKDHRKAVRAGDLNLEKKDKFFRRFTWPWRLAHLLFAISVMALVLTGMAVFYADTAWAKAVVVALGGPHMAGHIHRIAAFVMLGIFFVHLVYVTINLIRNRKTFKWFGPTSLVPRVKDFWDMVGMFKWGLGLGPRPSFDRWTYWEKFDYWAVFWGMAIIGGSGMTLAFPHVVASVLPGWLFNVAMVVHGEEAFLAAVFLFTVHFFNNHLRPVKFPPPDIVMFTGAVSLEEFKHEHWDEYSRLLESGELEKYLVDAPSKPLTLASKILGLVLLAFGFTLLVMIVIGFFHIGAH